MAFGDIAKLLASIDLDTKPFERGAGRVGGDLRKMDSGFSRISTRSLALGSAIGTGIERLAEKGINTLFGAIQAGEDSLNRLNDVQSQTAAVIASTGGKAGVSAAQVRSLAESLEQVTTADDKTIQSGENLLLTFTGIGKNVFPEATKAMVNLGIAMAQGDVANADFKSSAIQLGKALNDPLKGITALSRVGVSFSDEQKKQIKNFVKHGELAKAQGVILKELTTEFGKAGEAAGKSGAAGVRRLSDAVEDAQIALATGLAPALDDIRTQLAGALEDPKTQAALRDLGKFLGDAAKGGIAFAESIPWNQVADGLKAAAGFAGNLFKAFANLPPGVQATIVGLAGLNKLSGGGVIKVGVDLFKEGAGALFGQFFSRGSPANPMFVVDQGGSLAGAAGGAAKGGLGAAGKLFLVGEAIGLVAAVNEVRDNIASGLKDQAVGIHSAVSEQINAVKPDLAALAQSMAGVDQGIDAITSNPLNVLVGGDALTELQNMRAELGSALVKADDTAKANFRNQERDDASHANTQKQKLDLVRTKIEDSERQLTQKQQATTNSVRTAAQQIVDAIDRKKLEVNVFVDKGDAGSRPGAGGTVGKVTTSPPSGPGHSGI